MRDACRQPLADNGLAVIQAVRTPEGSKAVEIETTILHESGQYVAETLRMPIVDSRGVTAQAVGSAITYGRRYGLMAMVGIAPSDDIPDAGDDDGNAASGRDGGRVAPPRRSDDQLKELTGGREPVTGNVAQITSGKVLNPVTGRMVDPNSSSQQKVPGGPWDTLIESLRKCSDTGELCDWYLGNSDAIHALNPTMRSSMAEEWQKAIGEDLAKCGSADDCLAWHDLWERSFSVLPPKVCALVLEELTLRQRAVAPKITAAE